MIIDCFLVQVVQETPCTSIETSNYYDHHEPLKTTSAVRRVRFPYALPLKVNYFRKSAGKQVPSKTFFVEISGEKPACFVGHQRINACRELAGEAVVNDLVGQWKVFLRQRFSPTR